MTKTELLTQLAGFDWVNHLVGSPELLSVQADGTNVYSQNLLDVAIDTGVYRNVQFYVCNEGEPEEMAVYKDSIPASQVANAEDIFKDEISDLMIANYPNIMYRVEEAHANVRKGYMLVFEQNPADPENPLSVVLKGKGFIVNADDTITFIDVAEPSDILLNIVKK